tara:strand:+ start:160 stop:477 length:318 start_codon:yes stop_codon:yes gene_type:complete
VQRKHFSAISTAAPLLLNTVIFSCTHGYLVPHGGYVERYQECSLQKPVLLLDAMHLGLKFGRIPQLKQLNLECWKSRVSIPALLRVGVVEVSIWQGAEVEFQAVR